MSDEEKHGDHFDLPLLFNMSKQFLGPGGLSAECVEGKIFCGQESDRGVISILITILRF